MAKNVRLTAQNLYLGLVLPARVYRHRPGWTQEAERGSEGVCRATIEADEKRAVKRRCGLRTKSQRRSEVVGVAAAGLQIRVWTNRPGPALCPAPKGTTVVAKSKYIKAGKGSQQAIYAHLKYIQDRERRKGAGTQVFQPRERRHRTQGSL